MDKSGEREVKGVDGGIERGERGIYSSSSSPAMASDGFTIDQQTTSQYTGRRNEEREVDLHIPGTAAALFCSSSFCNFCSSSFSSAKMSDASSPWNSRNETRRGEVDQLSCLKCQSKEKEGILRKSRRVIRNLLKSPYCSRRALMKVVMEDLLGDYGISTEYEIIG